jgi:histidinol-phosphate aminotransferase
MRKPEIEIHELIANLQPYSPGMAIRVVQERYGISDVIKLASNENPLGCSEQVKAAIIPHLDKIHLYPDSASVALREAIAEHLQLDKSWITLGNGSDSLFRMVCQVFGLPGHENIIHQYAFMSYRIYTQACLSKSVIVPEPQFRVDLPSMLNAISKKTRIIFLANPNNPTGTYVTHAELVAFLEQVPAQIVVILDEAYAEYMSQPDFPQSLSLLEQYPNLVITRTFSKAYGLAGLRVGYCLAHPALIENMNHLRSPFNVTSISQVAALAAINDQDFIHKTQQWHEHSLAHLGAGIDALGLERLDSKVAFHTVKFSQPTEDIFSGLLQQGIIVRPLRSYGLDNYLRISLGTIEQNERVLTAITTLIND